jgi:hypothetical protein
MRRLIVLGAVLVLVLALAGTALAAKRRGTARPKAAVPAGQLQVSGTGAVTLNGQLAAVGVIPSNGQLVVTDIGGDTKLTLNGRPKRVSQRGTVRVPGASGQFYVAGKRLRVRVSGVSLTLSAAGRGRVSLAGVGSYALNGAAAQPWPSANGTIELLPQTP